LFIKGAIRNALSAKRDKNQHNYCYVRVLCQTDEASPSCLLNISPLTALMYKPRLIRSAHLYLNIDIFQAWICCGSPAKTCCVPDVNPCHEENKYYKCPALM